METYRIKNFYEHYKKNGGLLEFKAFKLIIQSFLKNALNDIIDGKSLQLGYKLGRIKISRYERNFSKPKVDWGASNKYKQQLIDEGKPLYNNETKEGYQWLIYHTDNSYYKFHWVKQFIKDTQDVNLHNVKFYQLKPYKKAKKKLSSSINDLSPVIYELSTNVF